VVALFAPVPANADIGASKVNEITTSDNLSSYDFPAATYSNNVLYIAFTTSTCQSSGSPPCDVNGWGAPLVTSVSGAGLTFTEIGPAGGQGFSSDNRRIQAWRALATSGATTGVVTATLDNISYSMGAVIIEFTGTKTSGTNGADAVANYATASGSATSLTVNMAAFADSNNRPVAWFSHRAAEPTTHETGYTELHDTNNGTTPVMGYMAEWHATVAETTPSASWTTGSNGGFALEIANADELAWWNSNYAYRMQITVTNNDSIQLGANTIASFTANTAALISGGKLRLDGNDWRIVYNNGGTQNEIAHLVEGGWNTASTETWFRLQAAIDPSASDGNYYVYYGYSGESTSPSTFTTSEQTLEEYITSDDQVAEALDLNSDEWGAAQGVQFNAGDSRYWKITRFSFYQNRSLAGSKGDVAGLIFDATGSLEGDEITNGKSDVVDADTFSNGYNDLPWSGAQPKVKTGTQYYIAILPTNPAGRSATTVWFRWDYDGPTGSYRSGTDECKGYGIHRDGTWGVQPTSGFWIPDGADRNFRVYGREAANDDLSASLGSESGLTTERWGEDSGRDDYTGVTEDTFMDSGSNDQEEGSCTGNDAVRIGYRTDAGTRAMRSLIKFNLTALQNLISSATQINSATLYVKIASKTGSDIAVDAFRVLKSWSQGDECHNVAESGETTWRYQSYNSTEWTTWGADSVGTDRGSSADDTTTITGTGWVSWDVTQSVKNMFYDGNYDGWVLKSQSETGTNWSAFWSSEDGTAANRPYLAITYATTSPNLNQIHYRWRDDTGYESASPTTVTYQKGDGKGTVSETDDAFIRSTAATTNYGSDAALLVDNSPDQHTAIKFPNIFGGGANQIPLGSTITSATLTVEVYDPGTDIDVYQLTESWIEGEVSWTNRVTGTAWSNAGADGTGSHKPTPDATFTNGVIGTKTIDVKTSVQNWSDGEANEGWVLIDTTTGGVDMYSSEYGTIASRPKLEVTFTYGSGAGFLADEDTPYSPLDKSTTIRLRLMVSNEGGETSGSIQYRLQYKESTGGTTLADVCLGLYQRHRRTHIGYC
jgi:hypothetical protein